MISGHYAKGKGHSDKKRINAMAATSIDSPHGGHACFTNSPISNKENNLYVSKVTKVQNACIKKQDSASIKSREGRLSLLIDCNQEVSW